MNITDKKHLIIESYKVSFDKETAYQKCFLTDEEKDLLDDDPEFQQQMDFHLIQKREKILTSLVNLSEHSEKEEIKLKATIELGKIIWPKKFHHDPKNKPATPVEINLTQNTLNVGEPEDNDRTATVLKILSENGALEPGAQDPTKGSAH